MARRRVTPGGGLVAAIGYATGLLRLGQSAAHIANLLFATGRAADLTQAQEVVTNASAGLSAGNKYRYLQPNYRLSGGNYATIPGLPDNYVYQVSVSFTSTADGSTEYRTVTVQSANPLTKEQILDTAAAQAEYANGRGQFDYNVWAAESETAGVRIVFAARRG